MLKSKKLPCNQLPIDEEGTKDYEQTETTINEPHEHPESGLSNDAFKSGQKKDKPLLPPTKKTFTPNNSTKAERDSNQQTNEKDETTISIGNR